MMLGVILGTAWTNRVALGWGRWLATAVLTLFLLTLAVFIALPASTPPLLGTDGQPVVGGVAKLTTTMIGGHEQALLIRGYDVGKPVLLYLSGGPGQSSLPWPRVLFEDLTRDFILVAWDQRGTGKSYAARTGDEALTTKMLVYGEPPYADLYAYVFVMGYYEKLYKPYTLPPAYVEKGTQANLGPWNVLGSEYNLVEKVNVLRGFLDTASVLYPQLQEIDFRRDVPQLETAVYILDGAAELEARRELALEWYNLLDAPIKRIYTFENAAHAVAFEQFEAFQKIMTETVLPETYTNKGE